MAKVNATDRKLRGSHVPPAEGTQDTTLLRYPSPRGTASVQSLQAGRAEGHSTYPRSAFLRRQQAPEGTEDRGGQGGEATPRTRGPRVAARYGVRTRSAEELSAQCPTGGDRCAGVVCTCRPEGARGAGLGGRCCCSFCKIISQPEAENIKGPLCFSLSSYSPNFKPSIHLVI